jgi:hypothetical protein
LKFKIEKCSKKYKRKQNKKVIYLFLFILFILIASARFFSNKNDLIKLVRNNITAENPYFIYVDLDDCKLYLFKGEKIIKKYKCSGGKDSTPSPLGTWTIISKDTWGEGFGGRWMGFNVPWGKYGIHGTTLPDTVGWNASHGCIRMYNKDVAELYKIVPHGTKVQIVKTPYGGFGYGLKRLKPGDRGSNIYALQSIMKRKGYYDGYISGIYGKNFENAVLRFKKLKGISEGSIINQGFYDALGIKLMD